MKLLMKKKNEISEAHSHVMLLQAVFWTVTYEVLLLFTTVY